MLMTIAYSLSFGFTFAFFDKEEFYLTRIEEMMKNKEVLKLMAKLYPLENKKWSCKYQS